MEENRTPQLHFRFEHFKDEAHETVALPSFYRGLRYIFDGYAPDYDAFLEGASTMVDHYEAVSRRLGVELLPPEPLVDMMGQWQLDEGNEIALGFFVLNVENYPDSPHARDSLGEAYEVLGEQDETGIDSQRD